MSFNAIRYYYYRGGQGYSPLQLGDKLEFWFDNSDATTVTLSSGDVTSQTDKTGNYTRSTAAPAANPEYVTSSVSNDKNSILFAGAEGLKLNTNTFSHTSGELFVVFRRHNNSTVGLTNNQFLVCNTKNDATTNYLMFSDFANSNANGNSIGINSTVAGVAHIGNCNDKSISDKKTIVNFRSDGSTYVVGFDRDLDRGVTFTTGSNTGAWFGDLVGANLFTFGYRTLSSGTAYSSHYEYEVIYCNEVLTDTERTKVLNYLNNKHDCYSDSSDKIGVILNGTSNAVGLATVLPNRLKIALPKGYIRTGTNTFANLLFGTNNEGSDATKYGAELSFVAALSEYLNQDIYLEKNTSSGSRYCTITGSNPVTGGTTTWKVSSADLYPGLETGVSELKTKLGTLGGINKTIFFLIGGENDTFYDGDANGFETNFNEVIDELTANASAPDYYIINKIRTDLVGTGSAPTRQASAIATVQTALENIKSSKIPNAILLDMENYSSAGDSVHFVGHQHVLIGRDAFDLIRPIL